MINPYFNGLMIFALLMFILITIVSHYGIKNLFRGSGDPASIATTFSEMLKTYGQITIGLFVILALITLILEEKSTSETVLPIISLISGYLLGASVESKIRSR